jgi:hypothetical protein
LATTGSKTVLIYHLSFTINIMEDVKKKPLPVAAAAAENSGENEHDGVPEISAGTVQEDDVFALLQFPEQHRQLGSVYMCSNGVCFAPEKQVQAERYAADNKLELRKLTL